MSEQYEIIVPTTPQKIGGLICEEIIGENTYFYIHEDDGTTITLNLTASAIFDMCDGEMKAEDMASVISETLDVSYDNALRDVQEVLAELAGFGFLEV